MSESVVEVAAAVIQRPDGSFLLAQRPQGKVYQGYWEFPGGKIEIGERPEQALARELQEELGLEVRRCYPWLTRTYHYPHARVRLHFMRVDCWKGEPHGREQQAIAWQIPGKAINSPVLPANGPILKALQLPQLYAITCASKLGTEEALKRLDSALAGGLRLIQVRDKDLDQKSRLEFAREVARRCAASAARVLINDDEELAASVAADGVHFSSHRLRSMTERPDFFWCAASCHDEGELLKAAELGMDFVVLGPVNHTASHTGVQPLGWAHFREIMSGYSLPVYALGGLNASDLPLAWSCGAHGIAMMSAAWRD